MTIFDFTSNGFEKWKFLEINRKTRKKHIVQKPEMGKIKVMFLCEDDEEFCCIYHYRTSEEIYSKIKSGELQDLSCSYIKDFDITRAASFSNRKLNWFTAGYTFWDGDTFFDHSDFLSPFTDFKGANFGGGNVSFKGVNFSETIVDFTSAGFEGNEVSFVGAKFGPRGCVFSKVNFGNARVNFDEAEFEGGKKSFDRIELLDGKMRFLSVKFGYGDLNFDFATLNGSDIYFDYAVFDGGAISFENVDLKGGRLNFHETRLRKACLSLFKVDADRIVFRDIKFENHNDLRIRKVNEFLIENCIIEKALVFDKEFSEIEKMSFSNTINLGQIYIDWKNNRVKKAINAYTPAVENKRGRIKKSKAPKSDKANQFKMLKENFKILGNYEDEDKAYREYMRNKTMGFPRNLVKIFGPIGSYGTRPLTILLSKVIIVLLFAWIFSSMGTMPNIAVAFSGTAFGWIYYSAVSFLTVGLGFFAQQTTSMAVLAIIEGSIGLLMMMYFAISIIRKILR